MMRCLIAAGQTQVSCGLQSLPTLISQQADDSQFLYIVVGEKSLPATKFSTPPTRQICNTAESDTAIGISAMASVGLKPL